MNTTVLEKIQSELERSGCDAFLLSGGDNMRYAAQVHLPFTDEHPGLAFVLFAKGRLPLVLSPSLWARSWERGSFRMSAPIREALMPRTPLRNWRRSSARWGWPP